MPRILICGFSKLLFPEFHTYLHEKTRPGTFCVWRIDSSAVRDRHNGRTRNNPIQSAVSTFRTVDGVLSLVFRWLRGKTLSCSTDNIASHSSLVLGSDDSSSIQILRLLINWRTRYLVLFEETTSQEILINTTGNWYCLHQQRRCPIQTKSHHWHLQTGWLCVALRNNSEYYSILFIGNSKCDRHHLQQFTYDNLFPTITKCIYLS